MDVYDKRVIVVNTHLTNLTQYARLEQIEKIIDRLSQIEYDLIVFCGDMNAVPASQEICSIKNYKFISTNKNNTYEEGLILDYIFYKSTFDMINKNKIIIEGLSDHYCLENSFSWCE